ncbi:MAG TPA: hypothetical protein VK484_01610 [Ferruginibacter sp.]|nr:hypothetical protein [Ferruginibacter sp.]
MDELKNILTIIAALSASVFFIWQIVAGWLVVNVEISIITERQSKSREQDWLAFKLVLKKGKTDTLQIKDIKARVRKQDGETIENGSFSFEEIHKLNAPGNKIDWNELNEDGRNISLSPDESFHLGRFVMAPAGEPLIVEMVLHGTRTMWGRGFQWRTSVVSLPVKKELDETANK